MSKDESAAESSVEKTSSHGGGDATPSGAEDRGTAGEGAAREDSQGWEDAENGRKHLRIPIFVKLAALSTLLILLVISSTNFFVIKKQKEQFLDQLMNLGESMVRILASYVPDKLLGEEELAIFQLLNDIAKHDQVLYVLVSDKDNKIMAHTDLEEVGKPYSAPKSIKQLRKNDQIDIVTTFHEGEEVLYVKSPLSFRGITLGNVSIAISQRAIQESIRKSVIYITVMAVVVTILGVFMSLGLSMYFSRPIRKLVDRTRDMGRGDFTQRVDINRNDELGDLGVAFNKMAQDLELKEKIRDSFGRYVTPEIVDLVLESPDNKWMKGYRVDVTVLFVDIRGFTTLSENKEPEEIVELLNDYFSDVTDVVIKYGGHLNKFVGDEAMAVFGAPVSDADHAESAVRAALDIQSAIAEGNLKEERKSKISVGVGINSGETVAGNLGSDKRMEYTVIGDNVNVASRLTSLAKAGEILISERTYEHFSRKEIFIVEQRGKVSVKGRKEGLNILNVTSLSQA
ncbi:MAG: HAMP domain-containing protein [Deltaproteobacteria bacterium]|nr:HAMP domain-containing protein [Deltaproteobacteria bacterium]